MVYGSREIEQIHFDIKIRSMITTRVETFEQEQRKVCRFIH